MTSLETLTQQIQFIIEIDKVKSIYRKSKTYTGEKYENDAEHSWHICMMALVLSSHANEPIDLNKVIRMLLIHDIVEIDAGDTFLYATNRDDVFEKERQSAERIFGMLPAPQSKEYMALWLEFEAKQTPEAKFAGSIDRLQPLLSNIIHHGQTWKENGVTATQVYDKNSVIALGSSALWSYARTLLDQVVQDGNLV